MTVGSHIKHLREARGWSQAELARRLTDAKDGQPTQRESVSRWEKGIENPNADNIKALSLVFGRPPTEFERYGVYNTGGPIDPARRFIPQPSWQHVEAGGKVLKNALKSAPRLEVDDSVAERAFALVIEDDSMAPNFQPGDIIVIDPNVAPAHDAEDPDFVLVRLKTGQVVFRQYVLRARGAYDLVGLHADCGTVSVTAREPAEMLGTMVEHRRKRRRR